nr:TIGR02594 family protein [uncultured Carboxylicivirga sp.]
MTLLGFAINELGVKEISGSEHNPEILKYSSETGIKGMNTDEVPWCSAFVNWCVFKSNLPFSGKANARSWLNVGVETSEPHPGDIVVFWRESIDSWKGHVGVFMGFSANGQRVFCLGGNLGNAVSICDYDAQKVLGFRKIEKITNLVIPDSNLKIGDKGLDVMHLQKMLNYLGFNCGDVDFGIKTEKAIRLLQANNQLTEDGEYGKNTRQIIESLLQV